MSLNPEPRQTLCEVKRVPERKRLVSHQHPHLCMRVTACPAALPLLASAQSIRSVSCSYALPCRGAASRQPVSIFGRAAAPETLRIELLVAAPVHEPGGRGVAALDEPKAALALQTLRSRDGGFDAVPVGGGQREQRELPVFMERQLNGDGDGV
ncbi:hypothetical protein AOLI_G00327910 [Acnodon oligacanthus]